MELHHRLNNIFTSLSVFILKNTSFWELVIPVFRQGPRIVTTSLTRTLQVRPLLVWRQNESVTEM